MTTDRCPGCHAAVTPGAPWCTLCYLDLRAPAPEPAPAAERQLVPDLGPTLAPDPILDAPIARAAPIARREPSGWPCSCGTVVPMADDVCGHCGRAFLPTESLPTVSLPGIGDVSTMDRTQRVVFSVVAALVVTGLLVAVAFVGGSVL